MGNVITQIKLAKRKAERERRALARLQMQKSLCSMGPGAASMACIDNPGEITDFYYIESEKIGEGSYGRVCKCSNVSTGNPRAVKMLRKVRDQAVVDKFRQEIVLLRQLDHPHIAKLFEHFENNKFMYMVMQLCEGGDLFDHLISSGHCTEGQTATIMQQLFRAIFYMHSSNVAHRDLKLENLMLLRAGPVEGNTVKVVDFGSAKLFDDNEFMQTKLGAPYFIAPQILAGRYNELVDMWTLGVVMYCLMCGYPPFFGDSDAEVLAKVRVGYFYFNATDWKHVAESAKNLIRKLLKVNQTDRLSAKEALFDEWIMRKASLFRAPFKIRNVENMRLFGPMNKLKRAALTIMAAQLDEEYTGQLIETFMSLDESGEGTISHEELHEGLLKSGTDPKDIPKDLEGLCRDVDANHSGEITISEFLASTLDPRIYTNEEFCWAAFRIFDRNCDGKIGVKELRDTMTNGAYAVMSPEEKAHCTEEHSVLLNEVDEDGDGEIDFTEFMHMMLGTTKKRIANKKQKTHEDKVAGAAQLAEAAKEQGKTIAEYMKEQGGLQRALEGAANKVAEDNRKKKAEEDVVKKENLKRAKNALEEHKVEMEKAKTAALGEQDEAEVENVPASKVAGVASIASTIVRLPNKGAQKKGLAAASAFSATASAPAAKPPLDGPWIPNGGAASVATVATTLSRVDRKITRDKDKDKEVSTGSGNPKSPNGVATTGTIRAASKGATSGTKSAAPKIGRSADTDAVIKMESASAVVKKEKGGGGLQSKTAPSVSRTASKSKSRDRDIDKDKSK